MVPQLFCRSADGKLLNEILCLENGEMDILLAKPGASDLVGWPVYFDEKDGTRRYWPKPIEGCYVEQRKAAPMRAHNTEFAGIE